MERPSISLDGEWQFYTDPDADRTPGELAGLPARCVSVPAPWQSQGDDLRHYAGPAWYRKMITLPFTWIEKRIYLIFGAVDYRAQIWLNGMKVGEHEGGYLPFEIDVSEAARPGENELIVRVEDSLDEFLEVPHGKQSWYGLLSGIWQPVRVEARSELHITGLRATPLEHVVEVEAGLSRPLDHEESLVFEVLSPGGETAARLETTQTTAQLAVPSPQLWDLETPNLYTLRVTLNTELPDSLDAKFGFRTIEAREGRLLLNGRPVYLRGALDQDYYPERISTPPSRAYIEDEFRKAKAMGLNCLRVHIKVADPRYYEAADRVGILVWTELPNWQDLTPTARRRAQETLEGMVRRDWNHPSIIIWTIINESWGVDLVDPAQRLWLSEMYDRLKALDPTRLIVGNSACWGNHQVVTDVEDFHNYYAIPDHYRKWRRWVSGLASRPAWTFARQYTNFQDWRKFLRNPWSDKGYIFAPEVRRRGDEPLLLSEFGNWGLPDVQKLIECYGGEPAWFETGFDWSFGEVYPHGIEERFKTYRLERAFPSLADFSRASQWSQWKAMKYEIEQIRRQNGLSGYVITELTDVNWECNGLLDMCRNPKVYFERLGRLNADDLLAPETSRWAYWPGERVKIDLALSHYSTQEFSRTRLEWRLELEGQDAHGGLPYGKVNIPRAQPNTVTRLGVVSFAAPQVSRIQRGRVSFRLIAEGGQTVLENDLELTFFPARDENALRGIRLYAPGLEQAVERLGAVSVPDLSTCDAALVTVLTDELRAYLQAGGRVLWLAEDIKAQQTYLGTLKVFPRRKSVWQGDWASSISWLFRDRIFQDLPGDGVLDFTFADLTPEHVILGLHAHEFAVNVHAAIAVGWLHRTAATVALRRVGEGWLLVSTFRLSRFLGAHPTADWMAGELLLHLCSQSR